MTENLLRCLVSGCLAFHGIPLVTLNFVVFSAWAMDCGGDGSTSLTLVFSFDILLILAIRSALVALRS